MAATVTMPKLGLMMESGVVAAWRVSEGDQVNLGAVIAEISTSKVVYELEAEAQGVLLKIIVPKDGEVEVGALIALIGQPGEDISAFDGASFGGGGAAAVAGTLAEAEAAAVVAEMEPGARVKASPAAKKLAAELGVDLTRVAGTGPGGRITHEDVTAAASAAPAPSVAAEAFATPVAKRLAAELGVDLTGLAGSGPSGRIKAEDVAASAAPALLPGATELTDLRGGVAKQRPYAGVRRMVGEHMGASQKISPTVTYYGQADVEQLRQLLALVVEQTRRFDATIDGDVMMTATVVRAAALTLEKMPRFNATLDGDVIKVWRNINVGVAVALSQGLVVPVIREANRKGLSQIASEIRDLAGRARENQLLLDEMSGDTFTVSTLGPYRSVDFFSPIINQPEAAILGVGRMKDTVVAVDGVPVVRATMGLSLTCDHRLVDGGPSAEFLEMLMDYLAEPLRILV